MSETDAPLPAVRQPKSPETVGVTEARIAARADDTEALAEMMAETALQDALKRRRNQPARYDVKVESREDGAFRVGASVGGEVTDLVRRLNAFGTPSPEFATHMLNEVATAARSPGQQVPTTIQLNAALAAVDGMQPQNEAETMLAVQMCATHTAAMGMLNRMTQAQDPQGQQETGNLAIKLLRTYAAQMETMAKLQRGGEQKVRVEHVHVYEGGKAVVGDVNVHGRSDEFGEEPQGREGSAQGKPRLAALGNRRG